jgi:hypothetical protein
MAKIHKNSILQGIRGTLGELVIREMRNGSVRVNVKPVRKKRSHSQVQKDNNNRFRLAQAYAREAKSDPAYIVLAREAGSDAYHLAISDSMKPPVIHQIERRYRRVCVIASDNVMVTRVRIGILDRDGNPLEEGEAAQPDPLHEPERWEYAASSEGTVEATAWDLASNRTTALG